jgi:hypothetical protein
VYSRLPIIRPLIFTQFMNAEAKSKVPDWGIKSTLARGCLW